MNQKRGLDAELNSRRREVDISKGNRLAKRTNEFYWKAVTGVAMLMITVGTAAGFLGGIKSDYMMALENREADNQYVIDGYKITFLSGGHPEMEGLNGFTYTHLTDDIYIRKGMSLSQTEETCNHELMHNLGIGSEHHDFIEGNDEAVNTKLCDTLVELVKSDRHAW